MFYMTNLTISAQQNLLSMFIYGRFVFLLFVAICRIWFEMAYER